MKRSKIIRGISTKTPLALVLIVVALGSICVGSAQMQNVGEDFGKSWLTQYGNKFPKADVNKSQDLWSWGGKPRGYAVFNGELYPMLAMPEYYYPLLTDNTMKNTTPIIINATATVNSRSILPTNFMSPEYMTDPWFLAQITGQPVIVMYPGYDQGSTLL
jgi:hypothetical protein